VRVCGTAYEKNRFRRNVRWFTDVVFGETAALHDLRAFIQKTIRLDPGTVNGILAMAFGKVEELAQQLIMEVDSQKDILAVMEKANQALVRINSSMKTALSGLLDNVGQIDQSLDASSEEQTECRRDILQSTLDAVTHEIRNPLLAIGGLKLAMARKIVRPKRAGFPSPLRKGREIV
jgi:signal transduction histidine kinase